MLQESTEYYNIGTWLSKKLTYHLKSKTRRIKNLQVNHGEVWYCDLGYNIGAEKNKTRPVLVISNNKINRSEKVIVLCITDAQGKVNSRNLPAQDSWFLLYSDTTDQSKMIHPGRIIPTSSNTYSFLDKDSVIQCEEIRAVSKSRLDTTRGAIGIIQPDDLTFIKQKFKRAYNL